MIMKKRNITLFFLIIFYSVSFIDAQDQAGSPPIQVELWGGHNRLQFQSITIKPLDAHHKWDFFNLAVFDSHYSDDDKIFNESVIQSYVAYNIVNGFGIGMGGVFNSAVGASAHAVTQFVKGGKDYLVVIFSAAHIKKNPDFEIFSQIQYRPRLSETTSLFTQALLLASSKEFKSHNRSFVQLRLGLDNNKGLQCGLAYGYNEYGPFRESKGTIGLFLRTEIFR